MISFFIEENECSKCLKNNCYLDYYCQCCGLCTCTYCIALGSCCNRTGECICSCCEASCIGCCCNCDCKSEGGGGGGSGGGGGDEGLVGLALILIVILIAILIIYGFFYLMYYLTKKMGKYLSRTISLIINCFINLAIFFLVFPEEKELGTFIALSISAFIFLSNFFSIIIIILIYFKCCSLGNDTNLGTINSESISNFQLNKKVEENNKKDIAPEDKNSQNEEYYTPIIDYSSDISNKNKIKKEINYETNIAES